MCDEQSFVHSAALGCIKVPSGAGKTEILVYTRVFGEILESAGVQPIRLPPKSPNLNAYAERFVRSIKEECLTRVVPLGEGHLRRLVYEYIEHYHRERNHQGLDNRRCCAVRKLTRNVPYPQTR